MPLFEYKCGTCGYQFEELVSKDDLSEFSCKKCGNKSERQISSFSASVSGGSSNEPADLSIGRAANQRWQDYHDRQSKRHGDRELKNFELPKSNDGKYMPVMGLGKTTEKSQRTEYVSALQDHRKKRIEKGQMQFSGAGSF